MIAFVKAAINVDDPHFPFHYDLSDAQYMFVTRLQRFLETGLPKGHAMVGYFESFFANEKGDLDVISIKERYPEDYFDVDADE